jgi:predicted DNA-binding protein
MYVRGRSGSRHMKGKQVPLTLYLPPRKYWLLKSISSRAGATMQQVLREAVDQVLGEWHRESLRANLDERRRTGGG